VLGLPPFAGVEQLDQGGDHGRLQGACRQQLEQQVRHGVGRLIGVAQEGGAEHGRGHDDAHHAGDA
jgi:hypothetical protein